MLFGLPQGFWTHAQVVTRSTQSGVLFCCSYYLPSVGNFEVGGCGGGQ